MKLIQSILLFAATTAFAPLTLAHPGHHEHHSMTLAFLHHVTSVYHSLMSLAVLGGVMMIVGLAISLKHKTRRVTGAVLSIAGAGLLIGQF